LTAPSELSGELPTTSMIFVTANPAPFAVGCAEPTPAVACRAMEASAEERSGYLDWSKVSPAELAGMGAALVLLASLWLPWFTTSDNPNSKLACAGEGSTQCAVGPNDSANAWTVFSTLDWLLVAACAAPFILTWIVARGHALTWKPGEVTMIVGIVAFVLILCNGIILGRPDPGIEVGLGIGYFVALIASIGLLAAGYLRQAVYTTARKPPGVI
jgi:hypothetical protein